LGFDLNDLEDRIRRLWPKEAPTIIERGNISYWTTVNWEPRLGMLGTILGTFKHPSGRLLYLMEFSHDGVSLYCPFELNGVELTR
jgi:hypothetical protein